MFQTSGWRSETLKQQPSDSCSPCARHFLTATNLILSLSFYTIWYKNATEILGPAGKICRTAMIKSEGQTTWRFSMCLSLANPLDSVFFQVPQLCLHVADQIQRTVTQHCAAGSGLLQRQGNAAADGIAGGDRRSQLPDIRCQLPGRQGAGVIRREVMKERA